MSTTTYSDCHLEQTMPETNINSSFMARCSFCGEGCKLVEIPAVISSQIELTIRRWKDGEVTPEAMFNTLRNEYRNVWNGLAYQVKPHLTKGGTPKYKFDIARMEWKAMEEVK